MESINKWLTPLNTVLLAVLFVVVLVGGNQSASFSGSTDDSFTAADLISNDDLTVVDDATIGGDIDVSNLVSGGASIATTTNDAGTFTAAQVCDNNLIVATPNVGAVTLTFPTA